MGWSTGVFVACCTASLVVGSNAASSTQHAESSHIDTNRRFPILPRRELYFNNSTRLADTFSNMISISATPADSTIFTSTETKSSTIQYDASTATTSTRGYAIQLPSESLLVSTPDAPQSTSSKVLSSSTWWSSRTVSHSTTGDSTTSATPVVTVAPTWEWESRLVLLSISNAASVTSGVSPSETESPVSVSENVFSSQNASKTITPVWSSSNTVFSTSLGAQQHENQNTALSTALSVARVQYVALSPSGSGVAYPIASASSRQQPHTDAPTETNSAVSISTAIPSITLPVSSNGVHPANSSTTTSRIISPVIYEMGTASPSTTLTGYETSPNPNATASATATGLLLHSVSSLTDWYSPSIFTTSTNVGVSSFATVTTTPTMTDAQQTALTSSENLNFSTSPAVTLNNTSLIYPTAGFKPESNMAHVAGSSPIFSWPSAQTSSINTGYPTATESASSTITSTGIATQPSSSYAALLLSYSSASLSAIYPTHTWGPGGLSNMTRSNTSLQTTQTITQSSSDLESSMHTSTSMPTRESSDVQPISSNIILSIQPTVMSEIYPTLSATSMPSQVTKTPLVESTNTIELGTTGESIISSKSALPIGAESSSGTNTLSSQLFTSKSNAQSTSGATSTFITKTRTQISEVPSQTKLAPDETRVSATSSPTETAAAAPPPLTKSEAAGVALGSTAGVLLAIVAAIFIARRYHATRVAKRGSDGSGGVYPELAYLYDASILRPGSSSSSEGGEASAFMSGGAGGIPRSISTESRPPPRAPHNSFEYEYRHLHSVDGVRYSDPGNPFSEVVDPFLAWRSSAVISAPTDTVSALAAAVEGYSNGPQKPLPPLPVPVSTQAFRDHIIPSPTLSPLMNGCSLRRSTARSSGRSSVRSQRSLRKLHCSTSQDPTPGNYPPLSPYGRGPRHSLASIRESDSSSDPFSDPIEHDLLLPVDIRTETPDSVVVYAPAPVPRTALRPFIAHVLSNESPMTSMPTKTNPPPPKCRRLHSTGSLLFPKDEDTSCKYTSLPQDTQSSSYSTSNSSTEQIGYDAFPSPPSTSSPPLYKGWDDIKRRSVSPSPHQSSFSPPPPPFQAFGPPHANTSPPQPLLKKRSLILPLMSHNPFFPLTVKTPFTHTAAAASNPSFEGPRMSLLAKVQSIGDMKEEETGCGDRMMGSNKKEKRESAVMKGVGLGLGLGFGLGYRDSISKKKEMTARWGPDEVGRMV